MLDGLRPTHTGPNDDTPPSRMIHRMARGTRTMRRRTRGEAARRWNVRLEDRSLRLPQPLDAQEEEPTPPWSWRWEYDDVLRTVFALPVVPLGPSSQMLDDHIAFHVATKTRKTRTKKEPPTRAAALLHLLPFSPSMGEEEACAFVCHSFPSCQWSAERPKSTWVEGSASCCTRMTHERWFWRARRTLAPQDALWWWWWWW